MVKIWGRYENNKPEVIDEAESAVAGYLLNEYRIAFGRGWKLWLGLRKDEPK